jgi:hypothetical protein
MKRQKARSVTPTDVNETPTASTAEKLKFKKS